MEGASAEGGGSCPVTGKKPVASPRAGEAPRSGRWGRLIVPGVLALYLGVAAAVVALDFAVGRKALPRSHLQELLLGKQGRFGEDFNPLSQTGQMIISWAVGMLASLGMLAFYLIWHKVQAKFYVYKPLYRSWSLHFISGSCCTILSFAAFFTTWPYPLARLAAALDVLHLVTTIYQMRILMFGERDIIWPEYLAIMLAKAFFASWLFISPDDPMVVLRYGLTLCAFSYQRLFIYIFQMIYKGETHYTLANTMCGVVCAFQAVGVLLGSIIMCACMALYTFLLKGHAWVGDDITGGSKQVSSADRDVYFFRQKSFQSTAATVTRELSRGFETVSDLALASNDTEEQRECQQRRRWDIALRIVGMMCGCEDCNKAGAKDHHVRGLRNVLARFGYTETQISRVMEDCACHGEPSTSISLETVSLNPALAELLDHVFLDFAEALRVDAYYGPAQSGQPRKVTMQEVQSHSHAEDLWLAIEGKVYDLTEFAKRHPGGVDVLRLAAGTDATEIWQRTHGASQGVRSLMASFCVGALVKA